MEPLSYQSYLQNPKIREQIERDVRRMRREAVQQYIVTPIQALFSSRPRIRVTLVTRAA